MAKKTFKLIQKKGIGTVTIDLEGEKVNKLSSKVLEELDVLLDQLSEKPDLKAVIFESAKPGIFIAGADIEEIQALSDKATTKKLLERAHHIFNKLQNLKVPTIAAINGACLGGGLEFSLACTYRVASDSPKTQIGLPEVNLGIIPGFGGTQRLPRLIGLQQSLGLILTGKAVNGKKALKLHITDAYFDEAFFADKVRKFADDICSPKKAKALIEKRKIKGNVPFLLENSIPGRFMIFSKAKEGVLKQSKGHYPAPLVALEAVKKGTGKSLKQGLKAEINCFTKVANSDISNNLIHLFFLNELLKKDAGFTPKKATDPVDVTQAAVLGAGLMGGGIAWALSNRDIHVRMKDISWDAIAKGYEAASKIYGQLVKKRRLTKGQANVAMHRISGTLDYAGFKQTDVVVEAIVENMDVKKKVLAELEGQVGKNTILATNTSSLDVNEMGKDLKRPQQFVGMHFFSPVNRMPLVEVIPGVKTNDKTIQTIVALSRKLKKTPIVVQNCPGFLVNRILLPYVNEAVLCLEEGDDIERIDAIVETFGMPLGPLALGDEVGLDVGIKVSQVLEEGFGDRMKVPSSFHAVYANKEMHGKKTGKGFYVHVGKDKSVNPEMLSLLKDHKRNVEGFTRRDTLDRLILRMVNEAALCLEEGIVATASHLDMAMILGTGFPPFRGGLLKYADRLGIDHVVARLNELSLKYGDRFKPANLLVQLEKEQSTFF